MTERVTFHYMIRCSSTGMFSPGGSRADELWKSGDWKARGKVWTSMGALKNHLRQFDVSGRNSAGVWMSGLTTRIPESWEVITIAVKIDESEYGRVPANRLMGFVS